MAQSPNLSLSELAASPLDAVALVLPGMALNETIFPDLGMAEIAADFSAFDGRSGGGRVMDAYVDAVERLTHTPVWRNARRRLLVGHSFGGMLALAWLAARGTEGVHGVVLVSTTAGPMYDVAGLRLGRLAGREWRVPVGPLMRIWDSRLATWAMRRVVGAGGAGRGELDFQRYAGRSELAVGLAGWRLTSAGARHSFRAAMAGFDVRAALGGLRLPAIVLHGTRDVYFPVAVARTLAAGLPAAELRLVEGGGHVLPLSHPEMVRRAVDDLR